MPLHRQLNSYVKENLTWTMGQSILFLFVGLIALSLIGYWLRG